VFVGNNLTKTKNKKIALKISLPLKKILKKGENFRFILKGKVCRFWKKQANGILFEHLKKNNNKHSIDCIAVYMVK
jgi:hypothetical protein